MSEEITQETIKRDKLLLDLMIHVYDEDVARNELVDNKNSQRHSLTMSHKLPFVLSQ